MRVSTRLSDDEKQDTIFSDFGPGAWKLPLVSHGFMALLPSGQLSPVL